MAKRAEKGKKMTPFEYSQQIKDKNLTILKKGYNAWYKWFLRNPMVNSYFENADLSHQDLRGASFPCMNFEAADLRGADLRDVNFQGANLKLTKLCGADLRGANLWWANLAYADLTVANLAGAICRQTDMMEANLTGTDLTAAALEGASLRGAFTIQTVMTDAEVGGTLFAHVALSHVIGLESVKHSGPSEIGVDTLFISQGQIPDSFLRGAGVPETMIRYYRSLVIEPIQFYSCFVSYSSKDSEFAHRLYRDLLQRNVRVWFAPEDLKIGDRFRQRIDEAIRLYEKLLLVLSTDSVNSTWVEKEVETAFEKEQKNQALVLFPIMLDDAVFETDRAWAADIRRTRHIGDFRCWKNQDSYKKAFERLMRDLALEDGRTH